LIFEAKDIANTAPMVTRAIRVMATVTTYPVRMRCGELHQQPPTNTLNHLPAQLL
jgi:hypothetical protein